MTSTQGFKRNWHSLIEFMGMFSLRRRMQDWVHQEVVKDSSDEESFFPDLKKPVECKGQILWLTGLSGSGKTTISKGIEQELRDRGCPVELLDGDGVRANLSKGLGFSKEDRDTNISRLGFVANLLSRNGVVAIVAAISPYRAARDELRRTTKNFVEVYVNAPLEVCETRDVKGLYAMARAGEVRAFTGVNDPYEEPLNPDIVCYTSEESVEQSITKVLAELERREYIPAPVPYFSRKTGH